MNWRHRIIEADDDVTAVEALTGDELAVRVMRPLSETGYRRLAGLLKGRPDVQLWIDHPVEDLELLAGFPGLHRLAVRSLRLASWRGLRHVADTLEELLMNETTLKPISVAPVAGCARLEQLGIIGPVRDADTLGALTGLRDLSLRSVTLQGLEVLRPLTRLRSLALLLGGTTNLALLPEIGVLEEVELWRIRGLRDVAAVAEIPRLRELRLQAMSGITTLPSFAASRDLRLVVLDAMRGITDLRPIAAAPRLEELMLVAMPQLGLEDLRPLVGHPTLRRGVWGLGSTRKNVAAYDLLPLGDPPYGYPVG